MIMVTQDAIRSHRAANRIILSSVVPYFIQNGFFADHRYLNAAQFSFNSNINAAIRTAGYSHQAAMSNFDQTIEQ